MRSKLHDKEEVGIQAVMCQEQERKEMGIVAAHDVTSCKLRMLLSCSSIS